MDKSVSYHQNQDYSKSFAWTYELNKGLYKCYVKVKEDPKIGYMNQLQEYWVNSSRAKLFFIKILRDHVSSIIKCNVIIEMTFNIESRTIETNTERNNYNDNTNP